MRWFIGNLHDGGDLVDRLDFPGLERVLARAGGLQGLKTGGAGWPRVVAHPRLPHIRTCPTRASASSNRGFRYAQRAHPRDAIPTPHR